MAKNNIPKLKMTQPTKYKLENGLYCQIFFLKFLQEKA